MDDVVEVPGGHGAAVSLAAGERLEIVNTHGTQVVDFWAVATAEPAECLSMEHSRRVTGHLHPVVGDVLVSDRRDPMLVLEVDDFPGTHDTIVACCDPWLYRHYGVEDHRSCAENFREALGRLGLTPARTPNPLNLWMNVPVEGNSVSIGPPLSRPGDRVVFRALRDVTAVMSACPMDLPASTGAATINGTENRLMPVHYRVL